MATTVAAAAAAVVDKVASQFLLTMIFTEFTFTREWVVGGYPLSHVAVYFRNLLPWQQCVLSCASNLECARELSLRTPLARVVVVLPILNDFRQVLLELDHEEDFKQKALDALEELISELELTKREGEEYFETKSK